MVEVFDIESLLEEVFRACEVRAILQRMVIETPGEPIPEMRSESYSIAEGTVKRVAAFFREHGIEKAVLSQDISTDICPSIEEAAGVDRDECMKVLSNRAERIMLVSVGTSTTVAVSEIGGTMLVPDAVRNAVRSGVKPPRARRCSESWAEVQLPRTREFVKLSLSRMCVLRAAYSGWSFKAIPRRVLKAMGLDRLRPFAKTPPRGTLVTSISCANEYVAALLGATAMLVASGAQLVGEGCLPEAIASSADTAREVMERLGVMPILSGSPNEIVVAGKYGGVAVVLLPSPDVVPALRRVSLAGIAFANIAILMKLDTFVSLSWWVRPQKRVFLPTCRSWLKDAAREVEAATNALVEVANECLRAVAEACGPGS